MQDFEDLLDSLIERMEPYVSSVVDARVEEDYPKMLERDAKEAKDLEKAFAEETDPRMIPVMKEEINYLRNPPSKKALKSVSNRLNTDMFTACWYEVLRWSAKENDVIKLRDCLLPEELGRIEGAWNNTLSQLGFSQKEAEGILRKFGEEEIAYCLELPDAYVSRATEGYDLRRVKKK